MDVAYLSVAQIFDLVDMVIDCLDNTMRSAPA